MFQENDPKMQENDKTNESQKGLWSLLLIPKQKINNKQTQIIFIAKINTIQKTPPQIHITKGGASDGASNTLILHRARSYMKDTVRKSAFGRFHKKSTRYINSNFSHRNSGLILEKHIHKFDFS